MAVFFNQATLTYNDTTVNSNIVTGEIIEPLSLSKTAVGETYEEDGTITYVLSITNTSNTAYTDLTLTDNLGAYAFGEDTLVPLEYVEGTILYFVNGVLQTAPSVVAEDTLTVTGIDVPANGNALIIYQVQTNEFAPLEAGSVITNEATLTGEGICNEISDTETVTVQTEARLNITKALTPAVVTGNSEVTYTFVIENFGNAPVVATDNAVVTDTFEPLLEDISVTYNGVLWSTPANYTYNPETGEFATVAGQITVPAATYTQNPETGEWSAVPSTAVIEITGTIGCPGNS